MATPLPGRPIILIMGMAMGMGIRLTGPIIRDTPPTAMATTIDLGQGAGSLA
ncbi:hypothetical protein [Prosthecobacter sp.]